MTIQNFLLQVRGYGRMKTFSNTVAAHFENELESSNFHFCERENEINSIKMCFLSTIHLQG